MKLKYTIIASALLSLTAFSAAHAAKNSHQSKQQPLSRLIALLLQADLMQSMKQLMRYPAVLINWAPIPSTSRILTVAIMVVTGV